MKLAKIQFYCRVCEKKYAYIDTEGVCISLQKDCKHSPDNWASLVRTPITSSQAYNYLRNLRENLFYKVNMNYPSEQAEMYL